MKKLLVWTVVVLLSACGGGGGSGASGAGADGASGPGGASGGSTAINGANSISLDKQSITLVSGGFSVPDPTQDVIATFRGAGVVVGTLPGQSLPAWLSVSTPSATTTTSTVTFKLSGRGNVPGDNSTTLRFATGNSDQTGVAYQDLPVRVLVMPTTPAVPLSLSGPAGGKPVSAAVKVNTGNVIWNVSSDAPWLKADRGTVAGSAAIGIIADPAALASGNYIGNIVLEEPVSHARKSVKVQFGVDLPRLLVRQSGVALSLIGNTARLRASVMVSDNGQGGIGWVASTNQSWLRLDRQAGSTDSPLGLEADASGLANGQHYADITLSPNGAPAGTAGTTMRVGLYVDRTRQATSDINLQVVTGGYPERLLADPVRPFLYQSGNADTINIFNTAVAAPVQTIQIPGTRVTGIAISHDGRRLYAYDADSGKIYPVNLDTRAVLAALPNRVIGGSYQVRLAYAEVSGLPVLVTNHMVVVDVNSGKELARRSRSYPFEYPDILVQRDGRAVFVNGPLGRYELGWRAGVFTLGEPDEQNEPGSATGMALNASDTRLYTATGEFADMGVHLYDTATLAPVDNLPTVRSQAHGIAVNSDGRVYVVNWYDSTMLTYGADLVQTGTYKYGDHIDQVVLVENGKRPARPPSLPG